MKMIAAVFVGLVGLVSAAHAAPQDWVAIKGGTILMPPVDGAERAPVEVKPFLLSKTLVTVAQYAECVNAGGCTEPGSGPYADAACDDRTGRPNDPIDCVTWEQANAYARWKGARLPSEAEWVFAATNGTGEGRLGASCDSGTDAGSHSCGNFMPVPACTFPEWNVRVDGGEELCDMTGNVWQWVSKAYPDDFQILRGGSYYPKHGGYEAGSRRYRVAPTDHFANFGFRLAK